MRSVVAHVSTLGMHLQRHDANGWNELIQIVLQGVRQTRHGVVALLHSSRLYGGLSSCSRVGSDGLPRSSASAPRRAVPYWSKTVLNGV